MKKTILFLFSFISLSSSAQDLTVNTTQTINWNNNHNILYNFLQSGLAIDSQGNKIVVGGFDGAKVDFGTYDTITSENNSNIFIAKYDSNNNIIFLKNIGGSLSEGSLTVNANDYASDVKIDSDNNIYVLATINVSTLETIDLDPEHPESNSIISTSSGSWWTIDQNVFIIKYSPDGTMLWYREIQDENTDRSYNLFIDTNNDVWATGVIGGITGNDVDFDINNEYADNHDIIGNDFWEIGFVAHYNSNGDFIDVKSIDGGYLLNLNVCVAPSGNMYLSGSFSASKSDNAEGLSLFKNSASPIYIASQGFFELMAQNTDVFILKCNTSGNIEWVKTISSTSYNYTTDIAVYGDEYICISGRFSGSNVDFDTDNNLSFDTKTSASNGSGFVAKYNVDGNLTILKTIEGETLTRIQCLDVMDNGCVAVGGNFKGDVSFGDNSLNSSSSNSNPFIALIDTAGNWYDAQKINNDNYASIANVEITSNNSVQFIGFEAQSYTEGFYIESIFYGKAESELLSTVISDTVPIYRAITDIVCDDYKSPGGKIFDTSGIYTDTVAGPARDTIYTINLTVSKLDAEINIEGNVLTANVPNATYQWINCDTDTPVEGATNQTFTFVENGNYAVIIDNSICIDRSDCVSIIISGIGNVSDSEELEIFPNPTSEVINIKSSLNIKQLSLLDIAGNLILCQSKNNQINIRNLPKGIYILKATTDSGIVYTEKVVKE